MLPLASVHGDRSDRLLQPGSCAAAGRAAASPRPRGGSSRAARAGPRTAGYARGARSRSARGSGNGAGLADATGSPACPGTPNAGQAAGNDDVGRRSAVSAETLRIVASGSIQSFDPLWTTASGTGNVSNTILEGLFEYTSDYGIGPLIVESWESSDDNLSWTFKISRTASSSTTGTPLTTEQVQGTLNRQKDRAPILRLVRNEFGAGDAEFDEFFTIV